ncbi:phage head closure protein [Photorhabdus sp. CRCIA-P01]|uniref:phage head closure protein n=1 Tax=Photorhabdus sp. CRCIA-P01 TaxID=2019570 RepID=UPI000E59D053
MKAGELNKRIKLFRTVITRDELGAEIVTSEYVATVWAKAVAISNRKIRTADQQQVIETMQFTIRPRCDVDSDWLIEYQSRKFTVRAVDRNQSVRTMITTEADFRHDRA